MSLELVAKQVKDAIKVLPLLAKVQEALNEALLAVDAAKAADKRLDSTNLAITAAREDQRALLAASERIKAESDKMLADAKTDAATIRMRATESADNMVSKAAEKANVITKESDVAREKFAAQKTTNDEVLSMLQAQIAHGEAKLSEIRAAIAKITGA